MEIEERAKVVDLLQAMIAVDGVVGDEEREFLRRVVGRFGLSEHDRSDRVVASDPGRVMATLRALAPDVQARILELEAVDGREPIRERQLRAVVAAGLWPQQRAAWAAAARPM